MFAYITEGITAIKHSGRHDNWNLTTDEGELIAGHLKAKPPFKFRSWNDRLITHPISRLSLLWQKLCRLLLAQVLWRHIIQSKPNARFANRMQILYIFILSPFSSFIYSFASQRTMKILPTSKLKPKLVGRLPFLFLLFRQEKTGHPQTDSLIAR